MKIVPCACVCVCVRLFLEEVPFSTTDLHYQCNISVGFCERSKLCMLGKGAEPGRVQFGKTIILKPRQSVAFHGALSKLLSFHGAYIEVHIFVLFWLFDLVMYSEAHVRHRFVLKTSWR